MYTWDGQLIKSLIIAIYTLLLFYIIVFDVFDCVGVFTHSYTTVTYTNCYCSLRYSQHDFRTLH